MRVSDLTPDHVGRRISLTGRDWFVRGVLQEVSTYHDEISEMSIMEPDAEPVLGQKWTTIKVSGWEHNVSDAWNINVGMLE